METYTVSAILGQVSRVLFNALSTLLMNLFNVKSSPFLQNRFMYCNKGMLLPLPPYDIGSDEVKSKVQNLIVTMDIQQECKTTNNFNRQVKQDKTSVVLTPMPMVTYLLPLVCKPFNNAHRHLSS